MLALVLAIGMAPVVQASDPTYTEEWDGRGSDSLDCSKVGEGPRTDEGWIHWVFSTKGDSTSAQLVLGGTGNGTYGPGEPLVAEVWHFYTPYFNLTGLNATIYLYGGGPGTGGGLVVSDYCPGGDGAQAQATLSVVKFYDANANGELDAGEPLLDGWYFSINGTFYSTPFSDIFDVGTYNITELMPIESSWVASGITVEGTEDYNIVSNTEVEVTLVDEDDVTIYIGNYCLVPSGGMTLGFWSNKNGQATMNDGGNVTTELTLLSGLNLRNANGSNFDPGNYAAFKTWLLSATATNMAYMLSAQLAAMELNVEAGLVNGDAFYISYNGTINQLMTAANTALGADGDTPAGDPNRSTQEVLKNHLDALNNGASVVNPTPCTYTFL